MLAAIVTSCIIYLTYKNEFVEAKIKYNTYRAEKTRATPYRPFVISKTCLLKPDKGPCRAEIPMYYFEPGIQNCSSFTWGGCQGNGNRFDTELECTTTCLSRPNHPKTRPKWCSLTFDYGFCFGAINRWYYDPLWKVCKQRIYSGCGGNRNNFYNQEQCEALCRFGTGIMRSVVKEKSTIKSRLIVNSYNATTKGKDQVTSTKKD